MKAYISSLISESIRQISPSEAEGVLASSSFDVSYPKVEFGDYSSNAAMVLFKNFAQKPSENPAGFAKQIAEQAQKFDHKNIFESIESLGGFINFKLATKFLQSNLQIILEQQQDYGKKWQQSGEKIMLEYFQPNVAKPLHLGHLENGIYGDSLFKLLTHVGLTVESDTHLGDWGTQFGLLLLAYKKWGDLEIIEKDPITELNKLYVRINSEAEAAPNLREEGKLEFVKLEQGDQENLQLWEKFKDFSWKEFEFIYDDVGIRRADHNWPESFYADKMPSVLDLLKQKQLLVESQGAQIVNLEEYGLGIAVVVKSDGGTTYLLRDLATYIYRKNAGFVKQYYVVDARQSHALAQTFKILELLGVIESSTEALHLAYGFLKLPEGAMSTRKGTIVGAKDLYHQATIKAEEIILQKNPELQNKTKVAKQIAGGAIKYFILSRNLKTDIIFDRDAALSFEGNTGPYLQYTHARIYGIIRRAKQENLNFDISILQNFEATLAKSELLVLRKLQKFPEIIEASAKDFSPNILALYLYELAGDFNNFYQTQSILKEENLELQNFRLGVATATAQVLKNGLELLGITALEQM